jgi:glucose/arabinose dehydrogenase
MGNGGVRERVDDLASFSGKILRIDVTGVEEGYAVPEDNPFVDEPDAFSEIWNLGLRNPWRFTFDNDGETLFIADVGDDRWEEVNVVSTASSGLNFGHPYYEGETISPPYTEDDLNAEDYVFPAAVYPHAREGIDRLLSFCAVIGGVVYEGDTLPELSGQYFYSDWCSGTIWRMVKQGDVWQPEIFMSNTPYNINSFGKSMSGELYIATASGQVLKLINRD